jgi:hypothetical protein
MFSHCLNLHHEGALTNNKTVSMVRSVACHFKKATIHLKSSRAATIKPETYIILRRV